MEDVVNKKVLILGNGYVGQRLHEAYGCDISEKRIDTFDDAQSIVEKHKPEVIINCIGFTGDFNVDGCEKEIQKTLHANTFVPIILAEISVRYGIKLVHISSGCIYHYDYDHPPLVESVEPTFFDLYYSRSKIYTERALLPLVEQFGVAVARVRIPLDDRPHSKNLLNKLIKYKKVIDIPNSVTYLPDFIKMIQFLIESDGKGIYNTVNKGGLNYPNLLDIYKKYVPDFEFELLPLDKLNLVRTNCVLSTEKLEKEGFAVRNINDVLEECVKQYVA